MRVPALQAILRSQIALAAKGNARAQQAVIATVQAIEAEIEKEAPLNKSITVRFVKASGEPYDPESRKETPR